MKIQTDRFVRPPMKMRSKRKQGLMTGEVSRMLGGLISQSTVIRFFDHGILTGWKHPVRRYRVVDRESVKALAKKSGIELSEEMEVWTLKHVFCVLIDRYYRPCNKKSRKLYYSLACRN
jgi:hypothetical protein